MIYDIFCFSVGKTKSLKRIINSVPDDGRVLELCEICTSVEKFLPNMMLKSVKTLLTI